MRGMRANSLTAIIDFLCLGEANVFQDDLDDFLALAEELQLKGFDGISEGKVPDYPTESSNHTEKKAVVNQKQMPKKPMSIYVKFEKEGVGVMMTSYGQKPRKNSFIEPATMAEIESMIEQRIDGKYCTNCGYTSKKFGHMKEHVEKHIEGLEYPCNICNKIMRSSHLFREHTRRCPPIISSQI